MRGRALCLLINRRHRKSKSDAERKLRKFIQARTLRGRGNYLADFLDELRPNLVRDEALHMLVALALGRGPYMKRLANWGKDFWRFRGSDMAMRIPEHVISQRPSKVKRTPPPKKTRKVPRSGNLPKKRIMTASYAGFVSLSELESTSSAFGLEVSRDQ
jgi:hypothetical protein